MKITALLIICIAFSFTGYAQTERIAHRSHSGKDKTFKVTGYNNWGETPAMRAERLKRDSVMKAKADSIANIKKADRPVKSISKKSKRTKSVKKL